MACSRKKKPKKPKIGRFRCKACGQVRKNKNKLCDPKKIKKP